MKSKNILFPLGTTVGIIIFDLLAHGFENITYFTAILVGLFCFIIMYFWDKIRSKKS